MLLICGADAGEIPPFTGAQGPTEVWTWRSADRNATRWLPKRNITDQLPYFVSAARALEQPNSGSSTDLTPPLTPSGSSSDLLEKHGLAKAGKAPSTDLLEKMGLVAAAPPPPADPYDYYTASCDYYDGGASAVATPPTAASAPKKPSRTKLAVVLDPLNGSSLADAGVAVGTIFSIYRADGRDDDERG